MNKTASVGRKAFANRGMVKTSHSYSARRVEVDKIGGNSLCASLFSQLVEALAARKIVLSESKIDEILSKVNS